jgi:hypothetical protein
MQFGEAQKQEHEMVQVIGELSFSQAGRPVKASLSGDLHWTCNDESFEQLLNESFEMMDISPNVTEVHEPVVHGIYQLAERLGADVTVNERKLHAV